MLFNFECTERGCPKNDILSGLTVALALVPEAVAFAFVAGVEPLVGLYAAFMVGLITSVFGGRPGMISGATGALAVVMVSLVAQHGVEYLFAAVVLMGGIQVTVGILRLGKFIRIVPHPVMLGFVNGLAIVIFLAQLNSFQIKDAAGSTQWMQGQSLWIIHAGPGCTDHGDHSVPAETDQSRAFIAGGDCSGYTAGDFHRSGKSHGR